jgi:hypothetical protein
MDGPAPPKAPAFAGKLRLVKLPRRYGWALQQPVVYRSALPGVGEIIVPAGHVTDLESAPRWLPVAFAVAYDQAPAAAVVHDWACEHPERFPRRMADALFFEAMTVLVVAPWRRWAMWAAVRSFGLVTCRPGAWR